MVLDFVFFAFVLFLFYCVQNLYYLFLENFIVYIVLLLILLIHCLKLTNCIYFTRHRMRKYYTLTPWTNKTLFK